MVRNYDQQKEKYDDLINAMSRPGDIHLIAFPREEMEKLDARIDKLERDEIGNMAAFNAVDEYIKKLHDRIDNLERTIEENS